MRHDVHAVRRDRAQGDQQADGKPRRGPRLQSKPDQHRHGRQGAAHGHPFARVEGPVERAKHQNADRLRCRHRDQHVAPRHQIEPVHVMQVRASP